MSARRPMVAGNWKMNGSLAANESLVGGLRDGFGGQGTQASDLAPEIVICPPFPYLAQVQALMSAANLTESGVSLGAQNLADADNGAFTGEVSGPMLREVGCQWVIVGHSERRTLYGETDEMVAGKAQRALNADLAVMICVGETLEQRDRGQTEAVLAGQLDAVCPVLASATQARLIVIAYEPVWAIGTGKTASPDMAQDAHAFIRGQLERSQLASAGDIRLLYGGSVKPDSAPGLFAKPDIDGGLIGGASLVAQDFLAICRAANA